MSSVVLEVGPDNAIDLDAADASSNPLAQEAAEAAAANAVPWTGARPEAAGLALAGDAAAASKPAIATSKPHWMVEDLKAKAKAHVLKKEWVKAERAYTDAINWDAKSPILHANRSMARLSLGRTVEALSDADLSVALDPAYAKGWYRKGQALEKGHQWVKALEVYRHGAELEPANKAWASCVARAERAYAAAHRGAAPPPLRAGEKDALLEEFSFEDDARKAIVTVPFATKGVRQADCKLTVEVISWKQIQLDLYVTKGGKRHRFHLPRLFAHTKSEELSLKRGKLVLTLHKKDEGLWPSICLPTDAEIGAAAVREAARVEKEARALGFPSSGDKLEYDAHQTALALESEVKRRGFKDKGQMKAYDQATARRAEEARTAAEDAEMFKDQPFMNPNFLLANPPPSDPAPEYWPPRDGSRSLKTVAGT